MKSPLIIFALMLFISCKKDPEPNTTPPVLSVPFVNTALTKSFLPFGINLSPGHDNPTYEIKLTDTLENVVASCDGIISWIRQNEGIADYEIEVIPFSNSVYRIYYDHIKKPVVSEGQSIEAGDLIGKAGVFGRVELQINDTRDGQAYCPMLFGTTAFNTAFATALTIHNTNYGTSYVATCTKEQVTP